MAGNLDEELKYYPLHYAKMMNAPYSFNRKIQFAHSVYKSSIHESKDCYRFYFCTSVFLEQNGDFLFQ